MRGGLCPELQAGGAVPYSAGGFGPSKHMVLCPQTVHWLEILQALLLSPSAELQHRGAVVVMNMMAAAREVAELLIASEMLEILTVLAKDRDKPRVAQAAQESLERAVQYGLIQPHPGQQ